MPTRNINSDLKVNADLTLPSLSTYSGSDVTALMIAGADVVGKRALGTNAFNSTSFLPLAGGTLTGDLNLTYAYPRINLTDTNHNSDYSIINNDGIFSIYDITNNSHRLSISAAGNATFAGVIAAPAAVLSTTSTSDYVLRLLDTGVVGYDWSFPDTGTLKLGVNTTSTKTFKLINAGSGSFNLEADNVVSGGVTVSGALNINVGSSIHGTITSSSSSLTLNARNTGIMLFQSGGSEKMRIASSGNVGIGTTSPSAKLHVHGTSFFFDQAIFDDKVGIGTTSPTKELDVRDEARIWNGVNGIELSYSTSNTSGIVASANTSGNLEFRTNIGAAAKMFITNAGNVGIGTTSPIAKFEVTDGSSSITLQEYSNGAAIFLDGVDGDFTGGDYFHILANSNSYLGLGGYAGGATPLNISNAGNVGIGTSSPSAKLNAVGSGTIGGTNLANSFILAGTTSLGIGIDNNEIVSKGGAVYFGTADSHSILFRTNNASRMVVNSSGNVGIGTSSPDFQLDIENSSHATARLHAGTNASASLRLQNDAQHFDLNLQTNDKFAIYDHTAGTQPFTIMPTSGNVGIGTVSPAAKLDVFDPSTTAANTIVAQAIKNYVGGSSMFRVGLNAGSTTADIEMNSGGAGPFRYGSYGEMNIVNNRPSSKINIVNNSSVRATIDSSGNVGIGTTSPSKPLHVSFSGASGARIESTDNHSSLYIDSHSGKGQYIRFSENDTNKYWINSSGGKLYFRPAATGTAANQVIFDSSGNVGIGTTSPSTELHVAGDIRVAGQTSLLDMDAGAKIVGHYYANGGAELTFLQMYNPSDASINMGTKHSLGYISFAAGSGAYTERMRIKNDGNVGIGTANPNALLSVSHATAPTFRLSRTGTGQIWQQSIDSSGRLLINESASEGGTQYTRLAIDDDGNVGIGTTNPTARLDVSSPPNSNQLFLKDSSDGDITHNFWVDSVGHGQFWMYPEGQGVPKVRISTNDISYFNGGNVGIGTTSPAVDLQIGDGTVEKTLKVFHSDNTYTQISGYGLFMSRGSSYIRPTADNSKGLYIGSSNYQWNLVAQDATNHTFSTNGSESVRINSSGNVGIGTTSPQQILHLNTAEATIQFQSTHGKTSYINQGGGNFHIKASHSSGVAINYGDNNTALLNLYNNTTAAVSLRANGISYFNGGNALIVGATALRSSSVPTRFSVQAGMSEFETTLTNNNDWENSAISILERDNVGSAQSADKYSPNLNFHWSARVSNSLWMNSSGHLNWGSFGSNGIPNADGVFQTNTINLIGTGRITGVDTVSASTDAANKAYVDAQVGSADTLQEVTDNGNTTTNSIGIGTTTNPPHRLVVTDGASPYNSANMLLQVKRNSSNGNDDTSRSAIMLANNSNAFTIAYGGTTDRLRFIDGGNSEALTILNGGNVGIGTISPASGLHLQGASNTSSGFTIENTSGGTSKKFGFQPQYNDDRLDIWYNSNATAAITIKDGGNVGIGTTSPAYTLHVETNNNTTVLSRTTSNGASAAFTTWNNNGSSGNNMQLKSYGQGVSGTTFGVNVSKTNMLWSNGDTLMAMGTIGATPLIFGTSNAERMRINSSGNVGIGTTSPLDLLHIKSTSTDARMVLDGAVDAELKFFQSGTAKYTVGHDAASGNFVIGTTNVDAGQRLVINSAGNVGIGTTSPAQPLHVLDDSSANVHAKIRVQGGSTSGYADLGVQSNYVRLLVNDVQTTAYSGAVQYNYINGSVATTLTSTGLGIGTTSPNYPLEVKSASPFVTTNSTGTGNSGFAMLVNAGSNGVGVIATDNGGSLTFDNGATGAAQSEKMRITSAGNVGIGTGSPSTTLDVNGITTSDAFRTDTSNTAYNVISRNSTSTSLWVQAAQSGSIQGIASFRYGSATVNQGTEVCAIRRNSSYFINTKLGVGTNNPATTLDVEGTIKHKVYTVSTLPSASPAGQRAFVSDSSYSLSQAHGLVTAGSGSNFCPMYSDGTNWRVG